MNWTEITVNVPLEYTDTAAAIANMTVPYGIYIEDYSDLEQEAEEIAHIDLIDEELVKKDRTKSVIHIYISECDNAEESLAFLKERLAAEKIPFEVGAVGVNDNDWNENWKKYFHATEIGKRLAIVPSWESYENVSGRKILHIDPGAAFGTGTHATTSLCLAMLENYVKTGTKMLDIGCGSGILSIAAVLLGAEKAVGVDIDAQSVKTARENAEPAEKPKTPGSSGESGQEDTSPELVLPERETGQVSPMRYLLIGALLAAAICIAVYLFTHPVREEDAPSAQDKD